MNKAYHPSQQSTTRHNSLPPITTVYHPLQQFQNLIEFNCFNDIEEVNTLYVI